MNPSSARPTLWRACFGAGLGLLLAAPVATSARSVPTRVECRRQCATLIELCQQNGAKRAYCRRHIVRQCRHLGLAWCEIDVVPTTTTVFTTSTTSTTIDPGPTVNGCNRVEAEDHRGESPVVVQFIPFDYAPECIRVSPGATVRFEGDFRTFPLIGGEATLSDDLSPFAPTTTSGSSKEFVLSQPGIFPYHTEILWTALFRMWGAVIVE